MTTLPEDGPGRRRILFIADASLKDPRQGTPLRICSILREIRKAHDLWVCARTVPEEFADRFVEYPRGGRLDRVRFVRERMVSLSIEWVMTATEHILAMPVALKLLEGCRIAVDLHGLAAEEARASGAIGPTSCNLLKVRNWLLLPFYDRVFVVSEKLRSYYFPLSRSSGWKVVYGGTDGGAVATPVASPAVENGFVVGYTGNARDYQGLPYLLDATAALRERGVPVRLNLIVNGNERDMLDLLRARRLDDLACLRCNVTHDEADALIRRSHVLAIPRPSTPVTEYAFPSKLPEYLATGIPVIVTDVGPVRELYGELAGSAIVISHEDIRLALAEALMRVYRMSETERLGLGARGRKLAGTVFSWANLGAAIAAAFE